MIAVKLSRNFSIIEFIEQISKYHVYTESERRKYKIHFEENPKQILNQIEYFKKSVIHIKWLLNFSTFSFWLFWAKFLSAVFKGISQIENLFYHFSWFTVSISQSDVQLHSRGTMPTTMPIPRSPQVTMSITIPIPQSQHNQGMPVQQRHTPREQDWHKFHYDDYFFQYSDSLFSLKGAFELVPSCTRPSVIKACIVLTIFLY